jgi:hypothetical protein
MGRADAIAVLPMTGVHRRYKTCSATVRSHGS